MNRLHFFTQLFHHPDAFSVCVVAAVVIVGAAAIYLLSRTEITLLVLAALVLQMFSGNWSLMGISIPLDRVALALALGALVLKGARKVAARRLVLRGVHLALLAAVTWCAISGLMAGTLTGHDGFYAFLDRFGVVPFLLFCLAPIFFGDERHRRMLLITLTVIGLYLGLTGCLEGLHLYKLVLPRYIADPNVGIQWGRARGPILETTGNGFCTFVGAAAATIGLATWKSRRAIWACRLTVVLDAGCLFFTLTRSVWIGAFLGFVGVMLLTSRTRRMLVPLLLGGALVVGASMAASTTLRNEVTGRAESQSPVWDRINTDIAALHIVEQEPLTGVGWQNFENVSVNYMTEQPGTPITGEGIEVHNVFLSHAAELGIPGLLLWLLAFGGAVWRAFFPGRSRQVREDLAPPSEKELRLWRAGALAILLCFVVEASLAPFSQALPNSLLWTWLGVCAIPYTSTARARVATMTLTRAFTRPRARLAMPAPGEPEPIYL